MGGRFNKQFLRLSLSLLLAAGASNTAVMSAEPPAGSNSINMNELTILENRYFSQPYAHDPVEKRLERLECLVYGSTREGSNPERLARLSKTVATRSQQPIAQEKGATTVTPSQKEGESAAKPPQSSNQYPILNTLEWKALKKTYTNESLDQRLNRLESKMFGQPAETMAYADRVERLKKTVGIGLNTQQASDGFTATGPMPKARPRGEENGFDSMEGFSMPPSAVVPEINNNPLNLMLPFGNLGNMFGATNLNGMHKQMMDLMNQMQNPNSAPGNGESIQILPDGGVMRSWSKSFTLDPETKNFIERNGGGNDLKKLDKMLPKTEQASPAQPSPQQDSRQLKDLPGYADPNSI